VSGELSRRRGHLLFWALVALFELVVIAALAGLAVPLRLPVIGVAPSGFIVILAVHATVFSARRRIVVPGGLVRAWTIATRSLCARGKPVTLEARLIRVTRE
jgi:hypothetical protein